MSSSSIASSRRCTSARRHVFPDGVSFIHGDVGDPVAADRALDGVDAVVHLAAAVGVSQSMYEIERYVRVNTLATAAFSTPRPPCRGGRNDWSSPPPCRSTARASIGARSTETSPRGLRPEEQPSPGTGSVCPACGPSSPRSRRARASTDPDVGVRDHEARPREALPGRGGRVRRANRRPPFLQHLRLGSGSLEPVHGRRSDLLVASPEQPCAAVCEDGLQSGDFIHVSDIVRAIVLALESEDAVGHAVNVGTGRPVTVREVAELLAAGLDTDIAPEFPATYRMGDIRHCFADPAAGLPGIQGENTLEEGIGKLLDGSDPTATDHVEEAAAGAARSPAVQLSRQAMHDLAVIVVSTNEARAGCARASPLSSSTVVRAPSTWSSPTTSRPTGPRTSWPTSSRPLASSGA